MSDVERFLGASRELADRGGLPQRRGQTHEEFKASGLTKIVLGRMLAQAAVLPMDVDRITVVSYDGDAQMLNALRGTVKGSVLHLEGDIPFKPGSGRNNVFGSGVHVSNVFVGGNITISSVGGSSFTSISGGGAGGDMMILNGREVDLERYIRIAVIIPRTLDVKVGGFVGAVGFTDDLDGNLDFSPSIRAELTAQYVHSLQGELRGSGKATLAGVLNDADLDVSGSGSFDIGSVGGSVRAKVAGSGDVVVRGGTSRQLRASVSGSGDIRHRGTVTGDARLRVSGSGNVTALAVQGEVDSSVSGSGQITANGRTYRPRW